MTESDWLTSRDVWAMLRHLTHEMTPSRPRERPLVSDRKLRLFACACCRQMPPMGERSRHAVEVAERFADGMATVEELDAARAADWVADWVADWAADWAADCAADRAVVRAVVRASADWAAVLAADWAAVSAAARATARAADWAAILRDVVGNPWRPVARLHKPEGCGVQAQDLECASCSQRLYGRRAEDVCPHPPRPDWLTPSVLSLALAAYAERREDGILDPDRLAVLADALEDGGAAGELLAHLHTSGPHYRGTWSLDLILGKE